MPNLPTDRSPADPLDDAAAHAGDHNTLHAFHNLIDAAGDLIVGTGADTAGKLAKGTALQQLRVNAGSTALEWATPGAPTADFVSLAVNSTMNVPTDTWTSITFPSEVEDVSGFHSTSANPERLTVPTGLAGVYLVAGVISFPASATGARFARLLHNSTTGTGQVAVTALASTGAVHRTRVLVTLVKRLAAADYLIMQGYQESGGTHDVSTSPAETILAMVRVGD